MAVQLLQEVSTRLPLSTTHDKPLAKSACTVCGLGSRNLYGITPTRLRNFPSLTVSTSEYLPTRKCLPRDVIRADMGTEESRRIPRVLTVAGSDSGAGAGIQADMKACGALGVYCTTAITAVTAQNTVGVQGIHEVPADFVASQVKSVLLDIGADVVKTGMLPSVEIIRSLCDILRTYPVKGLVVDPVLISTSGDELAGPAILDALRDDLFPLADLVTPNLPEASAIIGGDPVTTVAEMREAAEAIHQLGPRYVLVKGGHLPGTNTLIDVLYDGVEWHELPGSRIETRNTHGTGCTLASSIAAELAKGQSMLPAVLASKRYLKDVLEENATLKIGEGKQGPVNHLFKLSDWEKSSTQSKFRPESLLLYAVTDSSMNKTWGRSTSEAVRAAIEGGATIVQIREKEADTGEFLQEAETSLKVARDYGIPLLINDRIDIAIACDADGVHLGQSDLPVARARAILGPGKIIGVSCKTPEQAEKAWKDGADYVGSGGVYPTNTKKDNKTIGIEGLREVCYGSPIPVVAIGGISGANAAEVMAYPRPENLKGVAVVSAFFNQPDVKKATAAVKSVVEECLKDVSVPNTSS
ncbi:thiamine biosynthetic bifunctional enzyme TH1, chloroplastic isoform X1 [Physcomitrium patens]|uniref:Uncharacterized protein n=1 Tax=Physcomitrium patens TaxID=3218 RepID=A0A2K1LBJ3_PHYPA|nr:thiamine biosynthetic bifunctional enzyme TH1, chloroplastic-like isoform X1 [Physcomitrium patens]PNR63393.1 hypothetical protein PHYPA_001819 [Physcomitrium patens]|eukprot:XP_024394819.1 thiamine biosynthetic bifunctional enzyme TH1, chloroplastic-like isoform X1 [Physcomitrella patens]